MERTCAALNRRLRKYAGEDREAGDGEQEPGAEKEEAAAKGEEYDEKEKKTNNLVLIGTAVFAVALGILIFFFLPLAISTWFNVDKDAIAFNLVSGLIRVTLFVVYVWVISFFGEFIIKD